MSISNAESQELACFWVSGLSPLTMFRVNFTFLLCSAFLLISTVLSFPTDERDNVLIERQSTNRLVFCHFMVGFTPRGTLICFILVVN